MWPFVTPCHRKDLRRLDKEVFDFFDQSVYFIHGVPMKSLDDVIHATAQATSVEALGAYFLELASELGFDVASFHILRRGIHHRQSADMPLIHTFPQDWVDFYISERCFAHDPIIAQAQLERKPFHWFQVEELRAVTEGERRYLSLLRETGLTDGLAIPLFGPGGEVAYAGLGLMRGRLDLSPADLDRLHHVLYQIYNTCQGMTHAPKVARPDLSPREREVLLWAAKGKSNSVIAQILGISEHTVDSLLRRAFRKLEVTSRIAAVLRAVQWGIIHP